MAAIAKPTSDVYTVFTKPYEDVDPLKKKVDKKATK